MSVEKKASSSEREQTDESLRVERDKADEALGEPAVDVIADAVLSRARARADAVLATARARTDQQSALSRPGVTRPAALDRERVLEDRALQQERSGADALLRVERAEHLAFLAHEREETVSNALKFTPPDGAVTVRAERLGDELKFAVLDTGEGIPPAKLDAVFERFVQVTQGDRRGAGLAI